MNAGVLALNGDPMSWEPLSPLLLLDRAAAAFAGRPAVVAGAQSLTYGEFRDCSFKLAGAVRGLGAERGDRVAVLAHNTPMLLAAHYAVPAAAAVLVALNTRLKPAELAAILDHAGARLLLCDSELEAPAQAAAAIADTHIRVVVDAGEEGELAKLTMASQPLREQVRDERDLLSLNYTSGTTGDPKGVMYHHRGAFLQSIAMAFHARLGTDTAYLWTLPMFHCNGWCFTWAVTAAGGTHVCLPKVEPAEIWRLIREEGISHLCAAPTVLSMIAHHPDAGAKPLPRRLRVCTGGAPPSPSLIARLDGLGLDVTHLYGLTESFGPIVICEPQPEWSSADPEELSRLVARQGVGNVIAVPPRVIGSDGKDVPSDGKTLGEIALRGNDVMLGYYRAPELTQEAAPDGWFRTGDLAVRHADGYIEIRDRSKDVIISGGENIASVEIEQALASHPAVIEVAVVAAPDPHWGEVPVAYVTLQSSVEVQPEELIAHVKARLAGFKVPKRIIFGELPRTSTGKIMKYELRGRLKATAGTADDGAASTTKLGRG
jgi:fatty-acyl-CoA synthase